MAHSTGVTPNHTDSQYDVSMHGGTVEAAKQKSLRIVCITGDTQKSKSGKVGRYTDNVCDIISEVGAEQQQK